MKILKPVLMMVAMAASAVYDAPGMQPHGGGELTLVVTFIVLTGAVVMGVRAIVRRRWLCAAVMAAVILFGVACDRWLWLQSPPCPECDPQEYAHWLEVTDKG